MYFDKLLTDNTKEFKKMETKTMNTRLNKRELDIAISNMTGEKVTAEYITSRIASIQHHDLQGTLMLCVITIDNGFSVTGEAACIDPENFNRSVGETLSYKKAFDKLWPLFGFLLAEKRFINKENLSDSYIDNVMKDK